MQTETVSRWSRYLIYFILAVLPLERIPSLDITHPLSMTIRLSQVAGVILIALNLPTLWRRRSDLVRSPWVWLALFLLVCVISAGLATDLKRALSVTAFTIFEAVLAWVIAIRFERERIPTYLKIIVTSALVVCAFGLYQFFGDLFGLSTQWTGLRPQYTKAVFGFPRIQSTALEPLYFGDYLLIPVGLLAAAVATGKRSGRLALALIPMLAIVWLSVSRGAIVAMIIVLVLGCILALVLKRLRGIAWLVGSAVVSIGLAYLLLFISSVTALPGEAATHNSVKNFSKQATNVSSGESAQGRTVTRDLAITAFKHAPVLGIGPGNFGAYAAKEMPDRFGSGDTIVNNEPLELAAETGSLGLLAFVAFVIALYWGVFKQLRNLTQIPAVDLAFMLGLSIAFIGIAAQYMTFSTLYITHVWVTLGLLAGVTAALAGTKAARKSRTT